MTFNYRPDARYSAADNHILREKLRMLAKRPTHRLKSENIPRPFDFELLRDLELTAEVIVRLYLRLRETEKALAVLTDGAFEPMSPGVLDTEDEWTNASLTAYLTGKMDPPGFIEGTHKPKGAYTADGHVIHIFALEDIPEDTE